MHKPRPSPWVLGLGILDLTQEQMRDVARAMPHHTPLPFKAMLAGSILSLGAVLAAMDLARSQPLRDWWASELARRGKGYYERKRIR